MNPDVITRRRIFRNQVQRFRADANRRNDRVRISVLNETPEIVHELGHQVEFGLSMAHWLDIRQILNDRQATPNQVAIIANGQEAPMPVLGRYSAKVYASGDTEVMSRAVEVFSDPVQARAFINQGPVVAATILRLLRPLDFGNHFRLANR